MADRNNYSFSSQTSQSSPTAYSSTFSNNGSSSSQDLAQLAKVSNSPFKMNSSFRDSSIVRQSSFSSIPMNPNICENCKPALYSAYSDFESQKRNDQMTISNLMAERDDCLECMKSGDVPVENIPDFLFNGTSLAIKRIRDLEGHIRSADAEISSLKAQLANHD